MVFREKQHEDHPGASGAGSPSGAGGEGLAHIKNAGDDLLAAADNAIDQALSQDSGEFLRTGRQRSGQ